MRNRFYFIFLRVLRCFSSPGSPLGLAAVPASLPAGFPIRTSAGHRAFAPHRGFSQLVTSFLASESHRHPPCALIVFPCFFTSRLLSSCRPYSLVPLPVSDTAGAHSRCRTRRELRSILSLRFSRLAADYAISTCQPCCLALRQEQRTGVRHSGALLSSRSQHVNDLFLFLR